MLQVFLVLQWKVAHLPFIQNLPFIFVPREEPVMRRLPYKQSPTDWQSCFRAHKVAEMNLSTQEEIKASTPLVDVAAWRLIIAIHSPLHTGKACLPADWRKGLASSWLHITFPHISMHLTQENIKYTPNIIWNPGGHNKQISLHWFCITRRCFMSHLRTKERKMPKSCSVMERTINRLKEPWAMSVWKN